jgi:hypothetical protein
MEPTLHSGDSKGGSAGFAQSDRTELHKPSISDYLGLTSLVTSFILVAGQLTTRSVFADLGLGFPDVPREMAICYGTIILVLTFPMLLLGVLAREHFQAREKKRHGAMITGLRFATAAMICLFTNMAATIPILCGHPLSVEQWPNALPWFALPIPLALGIALAYGSRAETAISKSVAYFVSAILFLTIIFLSASQWMIVIKQLRPEFWGPASSPVQVREDKSGQLRSVILLFDLSSDYIVKTATNPSDLLRLSKSKNQLEMPSAGKQ